MSRSTQPKANLRMTLGAGRWARSSVAQLILKDAARLVVIGVFAGMVRSVGAAMLVRKLLFGTAACDVPTLLMVALLLGAAAMMAS